jgi:cytochrome b561
MSEAVVRVDAWAGSHTPQRPPTQELRLQPPGFCKLHAYQELKHMPIRNTTARWGALAQLFHWTIVALILVQLVLANQYNHLPLGMAKLGVIARHKSVGITIFLLAVLRLAWRLMNPVPPLPDTLKPYERVLAHITHFALYAIILVMPITGWIMSSARNFPVSWFGLVQLPDLVGQNKALYEAMHETHDILAGTLIAVAVLHVLAALKHHFILKDDTLRRMLPFTRTR